MCKNLDLRFGSSLGGLRMVFSKPRGISKGRRKRRARSAEHRDGTKITVEPPPKRVRVEESTEDELDSEAEERKHASSSDKETSPKLETSTSSMKSSSLVLQKSMEEKDVPSLSDEVAVEEKETPVTLTDDTRAKKLQLVVGVNAVTRQLEQGRLEVGLVCSTSPRMLCQHLLPLAATREVPFASLPDLSKTLSQLLGIKKAMCIGWKVWLSVREHSQAVFMS